MAYGTTNPSGGSEGEKDSSEVWDTIGYRSFINSDIEEIIIPDGVKAIGLEAFSGCQNLKRVVLPDGLEEIGFRAFSGCTNLESINIPDSVQKIEEYAFKGTKIKEFNIPNNLKYLGLQVFVQCSALETIYLSDSLSGYISPRTDTTKPYLNPHIAFSQCDSIKRIIFKDNAKKIPYYILDTLGLDVNNLTNLEEITFPNTIERIEYQGLASYPYDINVEQTFPNLKYIATQAFSNSGITEASFPNKLEYVDANTFYNCQNLIRVKNFGNLDYIPINCFSNCINLKLINIPSQIKKIKSGAFSGSGLLNVSIPDSVKEIGANIFSGCKDLITIKRLGRVQSIPRSCFYGCTSFRNIFIPNSVSDIEPSVFQNCPLEHIYYEGTQEQWNQITIDSTNTYVINRATIHYNSTPLN